MTAASQSLFRVFPWSDNFNTGIELIDEQHKRLVELLNELACHVVHNDDLELERIFTELTAYADYHFKTEEGIWRACFQDDAWFTRHQETHASFIPAVLKLQSSEPAKPHHIMIEDIIKFLIHWLAYHILDTDKRMALVIQGVGNGHSLDDAKWLADEAMNGSVKVLIDTVLNMYDSLSSRTLELMRERTERIKAEEKLQAAYDNLEHMVKERTADLRREIAEHQITTEELRRAMEEVEAASRAKTDFLANMSHELRTPLNAIIGFSELIEDGVIGPLPSAYQNYGQDIHAAGEHLLGIISDILDVSMAEIGELRISPAEVRLINVVGTCESIVRARAEKAGIELVCEMPEGLPKINADPLRLQQILLNLVTNALKYTPTGGRVTFTAFLRSDGGLQFTVTDTGKGIAPEDIARAMEKFGQIRKGHVYAHEGPGLGLPIANALMESHGGTLHIDSAPGKGTTVTLRFPPERTVRA